MIDDMRLRDCLRVPQEPGTLPSDLHNGYSNACMYVWRCQEYVYMVGSRRGRKAFFFSSNIRIHPGTGLPITGSSMGFPRNLR